MPRILCIYYSQSGQLLQILQSICTTLDAAVHFEPIRPVADFPFPWQKQAFLDAMPEAVEGIGVPVHAIPNEIVSADWDLIILGYGPWFLHPSQPVTGFLQSGDAARLLKGRNVITVIGCRNMWLNAHERVKEALSKLSANLAGNIVLEDRQPNITSLLTIIRWMFKGQKEASGKLPEAGVNSADIDNAKRFGLVIREALRNDPETLQARIIDSGGVKVHPSLLLLEKRGVKGFRKWAARIRAKGGPGDAARQPLVSAFGRLLTFSVFALSPVAGTLAKAQGALMRRKLRKETEYFSSVRFEKGRF